jgi:hypothetical protein
MFQYFNSRVLSEKLGINLARWKRWSREFLPPDPLGGKQSGYARQYALNEAFIVFLGGYLVGNLGLSIPEAKTLLKSIGEWMAEKNLFRDHESKLVSGNGTASVQKKAALVIFGGMNRKSSFVIQESVNQPFFHLNLYQGDGKSLNGSSQPSNGPTSVGSDHLEPVNTSAPTIAKILFIHSILNEFRGKLNL